MRQKLSFLVTMAIGTYIGVKIRPSNLKNTVPTVKLYIILKSSNNQTNFTNYTKRGKLVDGNKISCFTMTS